MAQSLSVCQRCNAQQPDPIRRFYRRIQRDVLTALGFGLAVDSGRIPDRLESPRAAFHDPERAVDQTIVPIKLSDPFKICREEFDLRCREILAES